VTILRRILQTLGWGAVGLLGGAFLLGYAAPYLPPARFWWTDLFAVVLPPLGLAVGLVGSVLLGQGLYRRRWGRVVVAGMLLGLVVLRFGPRPGGGDALADEDETLRLMTFNLPPSTVNDAASAKALTQLLQREAPDVLALQESWLKTGHSPDAGLGGASASTRRLLDETLGYGPPRVHPPQTTTYQPVLGRSLLDSLTVHPLPPDGETNPRSRYTRAHFTWRGREVVLYNLHLHTVGMNPGEMLARGAFFSHWRTVLRTYREGALRRAEQARLIRRHLDWETRPVLVAGDFNSTRHQWAYRHIAEGLQRADGERTFPAHRPLVRIDHILTGPAWEIVSTRVPFREGDTPVSDHRPVAVHLRWAHDASD
jgi:endonuclease/exonuclease/phosphatase family metal-dependent hydrolase